MTSRNRCTRKSPNLVPITSSSNQHVTMTVTTGMVTAHRRSSTSCTRARRRRRSWPAPRGASTASSPPWRPFRARCGWAASSLRSPTRRAAKPHRSRARTARATRSGRRRFRHGRRSPGRGLLHRLYRRTTKSLSGPLVLECTSCATASQCGRRLGAAGGHPHSSAMGALLALRPGSRREPHARRSRNSRAARMPFRAPLMRRLRAARVQLGGHLGAARTRVASATTPCARPSRATAPRGRRPGAAPPRSALS